MELAEELSVEDYPCPSGGCLLTDKIFSKKVRDLFDNKDEIDNKDLQLLKLGRHFRYKYTKVVVGRNQTENERLKGLVRPGETLIEPVSFPGPLAIICGTSKNGIKDFAGGLLMRYASAKAGERATLRATCDGVSTEFEHETPTNEELIEELRVC